MTNAPPLQTSDQVWLTRAIVALMLLTCAIMISQRMVDPDLWGHIQYGEDWLAEGALPRVASHTYAASDHEWVNHENLSELALAFGHRAVGGLGLMVGKATLGVLMFLSMIFVARRHGVHPVLAAASMLAVAGALAEFWCARPQLASFLSCAAMLLVFESAFTSGPGGPQVRFRRLLLVLPVMIVWTNAHGGFVAGFCITAAYLGLKAIEILWIRHRAGMRTFAALCGVIVATGAVTLLNPYGPDLLLWLLRSLGQPRPEITEWVSIPNSGPTILPFTVLSVLTLASLRWSNLRRDPARFITIGLVAAQTFLHCRHIAFFAILFGFWMPPHLQSVWDRIRAAGPVRPAPAPMTRRAAWILGTQFVAVAALLLGILGYQFGQFGVDREEYPVDAIAFMGQHNLNGRIVVTFNWAQYTLAALPQSTVGFDGRFRTCYPQTVVDMNFDFILGNIPGRRYRSPESGEFDPDAVLGFACPDLVLIDRHGDWPATRVMEKRSDWTLLYQDQLAQVWGRADKYDNPDSPHFLAARSISDHPVSGLAPWPAFPDRGGRNAFVQSARTYLAARDRQPAAPRTAPRTAHRAIAAEIFKACLALRSPVLPTFPVRF